jgi:prevent-host-death family protein
MSIPKISATEFQRDVGRYQDLAQHTPVAITRDGRDHAVLMSAELFEVITKGRVARRIEDADEATLDEIAGASVAPEYADLDRLLDDETA